MAMLVNQDGLPADLRAAGCGPGCGVGGGGWNDGGGSAQSRAVATRIRDRRVLAATRCATAERNVRQTQAAARASRTFSHCSTLLATSDKVTSACAIGSRCLR
jgi:hypothetical protein